MARAKNAMLEDENVIRVGSSPMTPAQLLMQRRPELLQALGTPTEFHAYPGLGHGFGLGTGTAAEGWIDDATAFWEAQMR